MCNQQMRQEGHDMAASSSESDEEVKQIDSNYDDEYKETWLKWSHQQHTFQDMHHQPDKIKPLPPPKKRIYDNPVTDCCDILFSTIWVIVIVIFAIVICVWVLKLPSEPSCGSNRNGSTMDMKRVTADLKILLEPVLFRSNAPWADDLLMMGLDEDDKFKIWAPQQHRDGIVQEVEHTLLQNLENMAAEYLKKLEVVGLDESFKLQRHAAISLFPGTGLTLAKRLTARLTAFFTSGETRYGISTSHMENLIGEKVWFDEKHVLGEIVSHVCEADPFREACLVQVDMEQIKHASEYMEERTSDFISGVYQGDIHDIPKERKQGFMKSEPGHMADIECKTVVDMKDGANILRDTVLWKGSSGKPGDSGAAILGKTKGGKYELVAMYMGVVPMGPEKILFSHAMHSALAFFNKQTSHPLKLYNPLTKHPAGCLAPSAPNQNPQMTTQTFHPGNTGIRHLLAAPTHSL